MGQCFSETSQKQKSLSKPGIKLNLTATDLKLVISYLKSMSKIKPNFDDNISVDAIAPELITENVPHGELFETSYKDTYRRYN